MARDPYKYFRIEARQLSDELGQGLLALERGGSGDEIVSRLLRLSHTLKGASRVVRLTAIADRAHAMEELLLPLRGQVGPVAPAVVEGLLGLFDQITVELAALPSPEGAQKPPVGTLEQPKSVAALPPEPAPWGMVTDAAEIDRLLAGTIETYAQLNALKDVSVQAQAASAISRQVAQEMESAARQASQGGGEARLLLGTMERLADISSEVERRLDETYRRVDREFRQLRDAIEQLRLAPARVLFPGCERAARDAAQVLGKEIDFTSAGGEIRFDSEVVRIVRDALHQLVRNAVAHGIEDRNARTAAGKPPMGKISVSVVRRGERIVFRCEDDGRGIDLRALREAAIRRGRPDFDPAQIGGDRLAQLLLQGGVSTSSVVSEVAGRGIGMDIVRDAITRLGAQFNVATEQGQGTAFELVVPQSLSSVEAVTVEDGDALVGVPLRAVRRARWLGPEDIRQSPEGEAILDEGEAIPLVSLAQLLGGQPAPAPAEKFPVLIVSGADKRAALRVGRVRGSGSIVFRPLPELAPATAVVAGASLDADGRPLLMLDREGIVEAVRSARPVAVDTGSKSQSLLVIDDSLTTRMLEQSILESAGYKVDLAVSGEEGLQLVRRSAYALILVDVEMPGMDGFTFIETIRQEPQLRDIPAILVTSRNAPEDRQRGIDVGAQDYVVKSEFDQTKLLDRIQQLIAT